jgi:hypothetical protein
MTTGRSLSLPAAIVVGCSILGVAVYFGLRDGLRPEPVTPAAPAASAPATATPVAEPSPPPPTTPKEPVPDRVFRQAQAALDALRPELVKTCWTPPAADEPKAIVLTYDVTFGADGGMLVLGISEHREAFRSSVASCVRELPRPALPVDPPGENVRVLLELRMP